MSFPVFGDGMLPMSKTKSPVSLSRRKWVSQLKKRKGISLSSSSLLVLLPVSIDRMIAAHVGGGGSSLLSLLIQMLISPGNALSDSPRNYVLPASWASHVPGKLTYIISHPICQGWQSRRERRSLTHGQ